MQNLSVIYLFPNIHKYMNNIYIYVGSKANQNIIQSKKWIVNTSHKNLTLKKEESKIKVSNS